MPGAVWSKLTGICGPARGAVLAECIRNRPARVWLAIIDDLRTAERLAEDVLFFLRAADPATTSQALLFPESIADSPDMREAFAASSDRLTVLSRLRGFPAGGSARGPGNTLVIVTTPAALLQPVPAALRGISKFTWVAEGENSYRLGLMNGSMLTVRVAAEPKTPLPLLVCTVSVPRTSLTLLTLIKSTAPSPLRSASDTELG